MKKLHMMFKTAEFKASFRCFYTLEMLLVLLLVLKMP